MASPLVAAGATHGAATARKVHVRIKLEATPHHDAIASLSERVARSIGVTPAAGAAAPIECVRDHHACGPHPTPEVLEPTRAPPLRSASGLCLDCGKVGEKITSDTVIHCSIFYLFMVNIVIP